MNAKESLLAAFEDGTLAQRTLPEILKILQIPYREKNRMFDLLQSLCDEGKIYRNDGGRYGTIEQLGLIKGVLCGNERGFAFLTPDGMQRNEADYFIPRKNLHGALHGDTVLIEKVWGESDDEGNVIAILARGYEKIVGTFRRDRRAGYLFPDEKRFNIRLTVSLSKTVNIPASLGEDCEYAGASASAFLLFIWRCLPSQS